jgi:hypothetical protein
MSDTVSKELSDILTWIAGHDAKCSERHNGIMNAIKALHDSDLTQRLEIKEVELKAEKNRETIAAIDKKIAFWAGLSAAGGGAIGTALSQVFGG